LSKLKTKTCRHKRAMSYWTPSRRKGHVTNVYAWCEISILQPRVAAALPVLLTAFSRYICYRNRLFIVFSVYGVFIYVIHNCARVYDSNKSVENRYTNTIRYTIWCRCAVIPFVSIRTGLYCLFDRKWRLSKKILYLHTISISCTW